MSTKMRLCFATNNKGKLQEIRDLLSDNYEIVSLQDIGCFEELPETNPTIEGNSFQKANYVWTNYKVNCFADDTGLEIEALNGAPGVYSAMYAGPECNADQNMELVLQKMRGIENRAALFRTCITLMVEGNTHQFEGNVKGVLLKEKSGAQGFGYDPIFMPEGKDVSFAEMSREEKNTISHRARAVRKLVEFLNSLA